MAALLSIVILDSCIKSPSPTFAEDLAPILHTNCSPCHRKDGGAPFPLITYKDALKKAKMMAFVTSTGYMPPWPADKHYSSFLNERTLSTQEISVFKDWLKGGCLLGDTTNLKTPNFSDKISVLGKPDMVINLQPITINGDNRDRFYVLKIPYEMDEAKIVKAVEFVPGQSQYTHHMNGHYLSFNDQSDVFNGENLADIEADNFTEQFMRLILTNSDGTLPSRVHSAVNYLPGAFGVRYPDGIGGFIMSKKGAFVANDIHYGPSRKTLIDSSKLYIYFSNTLPKRPTYELMLGTNGVSEIKPALQVAPNTISKHVTQLSVMNDISVLTVNPHMHLIGKSFKAYALKPNGDTVRLIHIPKWQFRWQYFYTYKNPVRIPRGSVIVVEAEFDNTTKNPNNPFNPPRMIGERLDRGGASMRTTDEMLQFIITYMPYLKGDETIDLSKP